MRDLAFELVDNHDEIEGLEQFLAEKNEQIEQLRRQFDGELGELFGAGTQGRRVEGEILLALADT